MAVRRRPSYGFDLAGTALGVRPEEGVSRSMLAQLFPELDLKTTSVKDTQAEEVEKPEEAASKVKQGTLLSIEEDDNIPGSEFEKFGVKGSLSYAAPINVQVGPTGPQGRGSRLGYTGAVQAAPKDVTPVEQKPETTPKSLAEMSAQDIFKSFSQYDQGQQGLFGGQDVDYLRGQGVGDETIREVARLSSETQQTPAAVYERLGGTLTSASATASGPSPQQYASNYLAGINDVGEKGIFGGQDVDAMRSKGYTDEQIRSTAMAIRRSGQNIPPAVFRRLGNF